MVVAGREAQPALALLTLLLSLSDMPGVPYVGKVTQERSLGAMLLVRMRSYYCCILISMQYSL